MGHFKKLLVLLSFLASTASASNDLCKLAAAQLNFGLTPWNERYDFQDMLDHLATARVIKIEPLKEFLGLETDNPGDGANAFLVTLEGGVLAVAKPKMEVGKMERFGFRFSEIAGFRLVPPTVLREIPNFPGGFQGSLQAFVVSPFWMHLKRDDRAEIVRGVSEKLASDLRLMIFLGRQWDSHLGNMTVDMAMTPALFDFDQTESPQMIRYGEQPYLRFTSLDQNEPSPDEFPFQHAVEIVSPFENTEAKITHVANQLQVPRASIQRLWARLRSSVTSMKIVKWQNALWLQREAGKFLGYTPVYSRQTLQNLIRIRTEDVRMILPYPTDLRAPVIINRIDQVLSASRQADATIIP